MDVQILRLNSNSPWFQVRCPLFSPCKSLETGVSCNTCCQQIATEIRGELCVSFGI